MGRSNNQRRASAKKKGTEFKPRHSTKSKRAKVSIKAQIANAKKFNEKKSLGVRSKRQIQKDRKATKKR